MGSNVRSSAIEDIDTSYCVSRRRARLSQHGHQVAMDQYAAVRVDLCCGFVEEDLLGRMLDNLARYRQRYRASTSRAARPSSGPMLIMRFMA